MITFFPSLQHFQLALIDSKLCTLSKAESKYRCYNCSSQPVTRYNVKYDHIWWAVLLVVCNTYWKGIGIFLQSRFFFFPLSLLLFPCWLCPRLGLPRRQHKERERAGSAFKHIADTHCDFRLHVHSGESVLLPLPSVLHSASSLYPLSFMEPLSSLISLFVWVFLLLFYFTNF